MTKVLKHCQQCNNIFYTEQKEINRGNGKFCSRKCSSIYTRQILINNQINNCVCAVCGKHFHKSNSKLNKVNKSGLHFCSRNCTDIARRSIVGILIRSDANNSTQYRTLAFAAFKHKCSKCGYAKIEEILQVHHLDRNRLNNTLENLILLCPTCHTEEHYLTNSGLYHNKKIK